MDFHDCRSMKLIFLPHCAANQNSRSNTCATCSAGEKEFMAGLLDRQISIMQMPCPELMALGLNRGGKDIYALLGNEEGLSVCRRLCRDIIYQIKQYQECDVKVVGIFGKSTSPSCGVETTYRDRGVHDGPGVFIQELQAALDQGGIDLPMTEFLDNQAQKNLAVVDQWAQRAGA